MRNRIITKIKILMTEKNIDINAYNFEEMNMVELKRLYSHLLIKKGAGSSGNKGAGGSNGKHYIKKNYVVVGRNTKNGPIPPIKLKLTAK